MNQLKTNKRKAVIAAFVEGNGVNSMVRMTGVSKPTILKLIRDLGCACAKFHNDTVRGLKPKSLQCDEIWAFCYAKQKNVPEEKRGVFGYGDVWTWTAIDPESKLIVTYHVGLRTATDAFAFMDDLSGRVVNVGTLTTDGYGAYPEAVRETFGNEANYAQLIKVYQADRSKEAHYSPSVCIGCQHKHVTGFPNPDDISTSIVERSNLTMRMGMRGFTRLTNGHSKKVENHGHAIALFFAYYNFCRKHQSLQGRTPAMAAGLSDHTWAIDEMIDLIG